MSKGLEALERLVDGNLNEVNYYRLVTNGTTLILQDKDTIEKELKEYEQLKQLKLLPYPQENGEEYRQCVIKRLMALEIIKEKPQATLWIIQHCDKEMEYEDMISIFKEDVTKEQFDLLKEVLNYDTNYIN